MHVAQTHQSGCRIDDPKAEKRLERLHTEFLVHLDYTMLAVMQLHVATEEWIEGFQE